jgi:hypothetical protein
LKWDKKILKKKSMQKERLYQLDCQHFAVILLFVTTITILTIDKLKLIEDNKDKLKIWAAVLVVALVLIEPLRCTPKKYIPPQMLMAQILINPQWLIKTNFKLATLVTPRLLPRSKMLLILTPPIITDNNLTLY